MFSGCRYALKRRFSFLGTMLVAVMVIGFMMASANEAHALTILFDQSGYTGKTWLQIQDPNFDNGNVRCLATYDSGTPIDFSQDGGGRTMMSDPVELSAIGTGGLNVTRAVGTVFYIYYDDPTSEPRTSAPNQMVSTKRFQPFELTINGGLGDQGDLTAINYFTAPLSISSYAMNPVIHPKEQPLQQAGFGENTGPQIAELLAAASGGKDAAVVKNAGDVIVRYLGPSNVFASNPWPSFVPYMQAVNTNRQVTKIKRQTGFNFPGTPLPVYQFGADMKATCDAQGNITLSGAITVSANGDVAKGNPSPPASGRWDNATIHFSVADEKEFNRAIYGQVKSKAVTFSGSGWEKFRQFTDSTLEKGHGTPHNVAKNPSLNDPGVFAYSVTQDMIIGEITTGILGGFVNSDYKVNGVAIKDMVSNKWWTLYPMVAFSEIQSEHPYYSQYSEVVFNESNNTVYGVPYSDRFGSGPLVNSVWYDGQDVNFWKVGIGVPVGIPQSIGDRIKGFWAD